MSSRQTKVLTIASVFLAVAGIAICTLSLIFMRPVDHSKWIGTNGRLANVVEKQKNYNGKETLFEQKVSYVTDKGNKIITTIPYVGIIPPAPWESIDIIYNPENPTQAEMAEQLPPEQPPLQTVLILGSGLILLGGFTYWYTKQQVKKQQTVEHNDQ